MFKTQNKRITGLDIKATGTQISKLINESGLNDKKLGEIMDLSVQSINKWRHGRSLPDIENMFILSRILGKRVDVFLVPIATEQPVFEVEIMERQEPASMLRRLKEYAIRLRTIFLNYTLNDSAA